MQNPDYPPSGSRRSGSEVRVCHRIADPGAPVLRQSRRVGEGRGGDHIRRAGAPGPAGARARATSGMGQGRCRAGCGPARPGAGVDLLRHRHRRPAATGRSAGATRCSQVRRLLAGVNWKAFAVLLVAGLLGVVAVLPYMMELVGRASLIGRLVRLPMPLVLTLALLQNSSVLAVTIVIGLILSNRVGLRMPLIQAMELADRSDDFRPWLESSSSFPSGVTVVDPVRLPGIAQGPHNPDCRPCDRSSRRRRLHLRRMPTCAGRSAQSIDGPRSCLPLHCRVEVDVCRRPADRSPPSRATRAAHVSTTASRAGAVRNPTVSSLLVRGESQRIRQTEREDIRRIPSGCTVASGSRRTTASWFAPRRLT